MKSFKDYALKLNIEDKEYFIANIRQGYRRWTIQLTTSTKNVLKRKNVKTLNKLLDDLVKVNDVKFYYQRQQLPPFDFIKFKADYLSTSIDRMVNEHKEFINKISHLSFFSEENDQKMMVLERKVGEHRRKIFEDIKKLKQYQKPKPKPKSKRKSIVEDVVIYPEIKIEIVDVSFNFRKFKLDKIINNENES